MTVGHNIFCSKADMPEKETTEIGTPGRTRLLTDSAAGALAAYPTAPEQMNVVNVTRPRRGHDY